MTFPKERPIADACFPKGDRLLTLAFPKGALTHHREAAVVRSCGGKKQ